MDVYVGTSGWYYVWNEEKNLDWYIRHSSLNAVELNASFYRFPFKNQIAGWAKWGATLRWCVKVHRFITHQHKFNEAAREIWEKFRSLFTPLDPYTGYYLFQSPPLMNDAERLAGFFSGIPSQEKCALEIRNKGLIMDDTVCKKLQELVLLVSVDSPDVKNRIFSGDVMYLRMHGREDWYQHTYSREELAQTADMIKDIGPERVYVFFNNDHAMLKNARLMRDLLA